MATKLGKVVTYHEELPLIKLWILQSCGVTRSGEILNTLYFHLHQTNSHQISQGRDLLWGLPPINSYNPLNMWSGNVTWQINDICTIHITNQSGDILREAPTIKAKWPFDHFAKERSRDSLKHFSIFARLMATKPGRVLTYGRRFSMQTLRSSPTSCSLSYQFSWKML